MVRRVVKFNLRAASCCNVLVVKGAGALRDTVLRTASATRYAALFKSLTTASASSPVLIFSLAPFFFTVSAVKIGAFAFSRNLTATVQYSSATKFSISLSRSATIFTATDCTRPALNPLRTLLQSRGLNLYPTRRSMIRRVCCASTMALLMTRGCFRASFTALAVISWNSTRQADFSFSPRICAKCQLIASPSRSGSVAR